jgi:DNA-binding GntR family transcriptional regulator
MAAASRQHLYSEIATELRSRILRGQYLPGCPLPSMAELTAEFDVSAITIRHALRELTFEGLIAGQQGRGVFVNPRPKIHRVLAGVTDRSIGEEVELAGFTARVQPLSSRIIKADREIATLLGVRLGARVHRHEKLTFADDEPVAHHTVHMRPELVGRLGGRIEGQFVLPLLKDENTELRCEFGAFALPLSLSSMFRKPAGSAMMRVQYTPLGKDRKPLFLAVMICPADRFVFEANFGASVHGPVVR